MSIKKIILTAIISIVVLSAVLAINSFYRALPFNPVEDSQQLVLVVSRTESANTAALRTYEYDGESWSYKFSCPVVIGRNGMAWGRGMHRDSARLADESVKQEGDGKSPKGAFQLLRAYGYPPQSMMRIKFPYTQTTPDMICIDESRSEYYNMIIAENETEQNTGEAVSHEDMLREDELYKFVILVGHNTIQPEPGAGSCIFLHVWEDEESSTAGCTAMSEENIIRLLGWLDPDKKPCFVQLTRTGYRRLKEEWNLPDITI